MDRRLAITFTIVVFAILSTPAFDTIAVGQGVSRYRSRSGGPTTTRVYRSYSVSPGSEVVSENSSVGEPGAIVSRPSPVSSGISNGVSNGSSRPSSSKPSYMRSDSKARGRFGR